MCFSQSGLRSAHFFVSQLPFVQFPPHFLHRPGCICVVKLQLCSSFSRSRLNLNIYWLCFEFSRYFVKHLFSMNRAWIGARANKHHNNSQRSQLFKKFKINFQKLGDATIHIFTLAMFGVLYRYCRSAGMRRKILARKVSPRIFINIWERATKPRECKQNLRTHSEKAPQETKNEARSY